MEQFVRDARIAQIYEGTNGIQAMDLVGRKLAKDGGRARPRLLRAARRGHRRRQGRRRPGRRRRARSNRRSATFRRATMWLAQNGMADPNNAGAGAYAYMELMGLVALGWMWLKMARRLGAAGGERMRGPRLPRSQARHRALLRRARAAAGGGAPAQGRSRRRKRDGAAGGGFLATRPSAWSTYQGCSIVTSLRLLASWEPGAPGRTRR